MSGGGSINAAIKTGVSEDNTTDKQLVIASERNRRRKEKILKRKRKVASRTYHSL